VRFPPPLLLLPLLIACQQAAPAGTSQEAALLAPAVQLTTPGLYYFAGVVDGDSSTLWWTDPGADDPAAGRREVATVAHAPGYPARGAVTADGTHVAWLRQPEGGRHHDPAELFLDGVRVDDVALYLQSPRFVGQTLMYLRRWPGEPRVDARGLQQQALDGFDLLAVSPGQKPRIVARWDALWVQLDGSDEGGVLATVVQDDGPRAVALSTSGAPADDPLPERLAPEATVRGRVGGHHWEVAVQTVGSDTLWRVHDRTGLDFVLERPTGDRVWLVPAADPAREVGLVGLVR
jgi:hypothetical protein